MDMGDSEATKAARKKLALAEAGPPGSLPMDTQAAGSYLSTLVSR